MVSGGSPGSPGSASRYGCAVLERVGLRWGSRSQLRTTAEAEAVPAAVRAAWALGLATLVLTVFGVVLAVVNRDSHLLPAGDGFDASEAVLAAAYGSAGWLLATRRPRVLFGWLLLAAGLGEALAAAGVGWAIFALSDGRGLPGAAWAGWVAHWAPGVEPVMVTLTWALFPSGRLPGGWLRVVAVVSVGLCALAVALGLFEPIVPAGATAPVLRHVTNPLGVQLPRGLQFGEALIVPGLALAYFLVLARWRRAQGDERKVLRWLGILNLANLAILPVVVVLPHGELLTTVGAVIEILLVSVVVLANQVFGIDVVLNRTLVYTLLTLLVAGVYGAGVALLAAVGVDVGGGWTVIAAVGAALCLLPARQRVQQLVNRYLYGERDDPYAVVSQVATRLESAGTTEQLLPGLLDALTRALRLPFASVELRAPDGTSRRIQHGHPVELSAQFPLLHQGQAVGELSVGLRSGQPTLGPRETRLLGDIARQLAVAASNVVLTEELIRSRERIVSAAEEERRRLRGDLHDGLGPVLTAAANKVDAARNLLPRSPSRVEELLVTVRADLTAALADLRRLVYALRPPALDELGLLAALQEQLHHAAVPVDLSLPEALPHLPAAVEVTAYRVIAEAVTNVARHSGASRCRVSIICTSLLTVEVCDNGPARGLWPPGVGLTSMRERTLALGGHWEAGPSPLGGRVRVELPLTLAEGAPA